MNVRATVRAGGVMLMSLVSVIGAQGLASPAMASPRIVHAAGAETLTDVESFDFASREHQCVLYVGQVVTYTGTLDGIARDVAPAQIRYFATCDEVFASNGTGIASTFTSVEHFVGNDGTEATLRNVGGTDTSGNYTGISAVHGDLNGVLHVSAHFMPGSPVVAAYDGLLAVTG